VPERSNGAVLKTVDPQGSVSSNLTPAVAQMLAIPVLAGDCERRPAISDFVRSRPHGPRVHRHRGLDVSTPPDQSRGQTCIDPCIDGLRKPVSTLYRRASKAVSAGFETCMAKHRNL
jgi:hypothetical protein